MKRASRSTEPAGSPAEASHIDAGHLARLEDAGLITRHDLGPLLTHMAAVCPRCAAAIDRWRGQPLAAADYSPAVERALAKVGEHLRSPTARPLAAEELANLLRLPAPQRRARVTSDRELARPALVMALVDEARRGLALHRPDAGDVASLAEALALRLPAGSVPLAVQLDLVAEAAPLRAQGELVLGHSDDAARTALCAHSLVLDGAGSPAVAAELLATGALLAWADHDPAACLERWHDLARHATHLEDPTLLTQARLAEAATYALIGDLPQAFQLRSQAPADSVGPHWIGVLEALAAWMGIKLSKPRAGGRGEVN